MKDESAKISAIVRREGNRMSVEWDHLEAQAALDEECAKLRERIAVLGRERDEARAQLAACPVGPAKDAPDEAGWWLMVPIDARWIRDACVSYVDSTEVWNPRGSKWYKLTVQP